MEGKLVSVIIPVYNVDRYLKKCIKSVLGQTYRNLEIILVDDGSKDKSPEICDKFARVDDRIIVIHKKNAGVSIARNVGIEHSRGEYLCFVDSDDFIPNDAIQSLYYGMIDSSSDLCCGTWAKISSKRTVYNQYCSQIIATSEKEALSAYLNIEEVNGPVAKLYKKSIIDSANIRFKEGVLIGEDAIFNYQYIQNCHTVSLINKTVYFYNKLNVDSVTHGFYADYNKCSLLCAIEQAKNVLSEKYPESSCLVQKNICGRFKNVIDYIMYYNLPEKVAVAKLEETYLMFKEYIKPDTVLSNAKSFAWLVQLLKYFEDREYTALYYYLQAQKKARKNNLMTKVGKKIINMLGWFKLLWIYKI